MAEAGRSGYTGGVDSLVSLALAASLVQASPRVRADPALQAIDRQLFEAEERVRPLEAIQPQGMEAQRDEFRRGRLRNPVFRYPGPLPYDTEAVEARLRGLRIEGEGMARLLARRRDTLLHLNRVVRHRGTRAVLWTTLRLNGRPDARLLARAAAILAQVPPEDHAHTPRVSREHFLSVLRHEVAAYGLEGWSVVAMDREGSTHVSAPTRTVFVADRATVLEGVPERLAVHEVGVHALRAANGYRQPYSMFATGTAGYQATEEGLAAYCELASGRGDPGTLRKYAGRVLAADAVARGLDFRDTYERLRGHGIDEGTCWETSVRAHRGGGYMKDHVYLQGLFEVLDYVDAGGRLADLFVGKIQVSEVAEVQAMVARGELLPPRWLPLRVPDPVPQDIPLLQLLRGLE